MYTILACLFLVSYVQCLKVGLYPYITDANSDGFAALAAGLTSKFKATTGIDDIELSFIDLAASYDTAALAQLLTSGTYDVIEMDQTLLGNLVATDSIAPWPQFPIDEWPNNNIRGSYFNGVNYGIPHWRCSYFTFTRTPSVSNANTIQKVVRSLNQLRGPSPKMRTLTNEYDLTAMYLTALQETRGPGSLANVLANNITDDDVVTNFAAFIDTCGDECFPNPYGPDFDYTSWARSFGAGQFNSFFYYSEALFHVLKGATDPSKIEKIDISLTALGSKKLPLQGPPIYTDALHKAKRCAQNTLCNSQAEAFARWYLSNEAYTYFLASQDVGPNAPLRYLLPATKGPFSVAPMSKDRFFRKLRTIFPPTTTSLPNDGSINNYLYTYYAHLKSVAFPSQE